MQTQPPFFYSWCLREISPLSDGFILQGGLDSSSRSDNFLLYWGIAGDFQSITVPVFFVAELTAFFFGGRRTPFD